jgi:hypothetical protein
MTPVATGLFSLRPEADQAHYPPLDRTSTIVIVRGRAITPKPAPTTSLIQRYPTAMRRFVDSTERTAWV